MSKSKKKRKGARNLSDWIQKVVLRPSQVEMVVLAELSSLLQRFGSKYLNLSSRSHDPVWLARYRLEMEAYAAWLEVLQQLLQGVPLEKINVPESLPVPTIPEVADSTVPGEPWLAFGLTEDQWGMDIHDLLRRSSDWGALATSNVLGRAEIKTVGDFYERWNVGIHNFGKMRLQVVKQVLKEADIPWTEAPIAPKISGGKPWEPFGLTKEQWRRPLGSLRKFAQDPVKEFRVLVSLSHTNLETVGQLYEFWQGVDKNLTVVRGIESNEIVLALRTILTRAGIPLPPSA